MNKIFLMTPVTTLREDQWILLANTQDGFRLLVFAISRSFVETSKTGSVEGLGAYLTHPVATFDNTAKGLTDAIRFGAAYDIAR